MTLTTPLFKIFTQEISWRDIILIAGGLFLLAKSTHEIHASLEGAGENKKTQQVVNFASTLIQISLLDIIFSLDSVITAVGLAEHLPVMILAIVIAVGVMMLSASAIGNFVDQHPTIKMLALSFLLLIGVSLVAESFNQHIPKGYIYFAMAFSVIVEILNLRMKGKSKPVELKRAVTAE